MLIHTDVMGLISPSSFQFGNQFIITFTDDAFCYMWAYPMLNKSSVHLAVSKLLKDMCHERSVSFDWGVSFR